MKACGLVGKAAGSDSLLAPLNGNILMGYFDLLWLILLIFRSSFLSTGFRSDAEETQSISARYPGPLDSKMELRVNL